ncbi:MAG: LysR family transcriptional regulator [Clostridia bacterium]|nr:LysR family transcriptional regulator [Clostridia bacterium]
MEISILAEFVKLVETRSFQETAEQMNVSQSALTKHIHKLEEELNITMFDRSQRSIQVNEYSLRFYSYARQILHAYEEGVAALQEMTAQDKTSITVCYNPLMGQYGLVDILTECSQSFPQHTLKPVESYSPMELLSSKKCDFAFVFESDAEGSAFSKMIYKTDHLAVVMPKDHPLAGSQSVTLQQLSGEHFILHSSHSSTPHDETRKFLELCQSQSFTPDIAAQSHLTSTMLHYVRNGKGIAVLNRMHMPYTDNDMAVIDISPTVRTYLYLMYPRRITAACAKAFLHFMVDYCNQ